jgi:hypothetical protein
MAAYFSLLIRLVFRCLPFTKVSQKKNKVYLETEKPYFQYVNLSKNLVHVIFTLLTAYRQAGLIFLHVCKTG